MQHGYIQENNAMLGKVSSIDILYHSKTMGNNTPYYYAINMLHHTEHLSDISDFTDTAEILLVRGSQVALVCWEL